MENFETAKPNEKGGAEQGSDKQPKMSLKGFESKKESLRGKLSDAMRDGRYEEVNDLKKEIDALNEQSENMAEQDAGSLAKQENPTSPASKAPPSLDAASALELKQHVDDSAKNLENSDINKNLAEKKDKKNSYEFALDKKESAEYISEAKDRLAELGDNKTEFASELLSYLDKVSKMKNFSLFRKSENGYSLQDKSITGLTRQMSTIQNAQESGKELKNFQEHLLYQAALRLFSEFSESDQSVMELFSSKEVLADTGVDESDSVIADEEIPSDLDFNQEINDSLLRQKNEIAENAKLADEALDKKLSTKVEEVAYVDVLNSNIPPSVGANKNLDRYYGTDFLEKHKSKIDIGRLERYSEKIAERARAVSETKFGKSILRGLSKLGTKDDKSWKKYAKKIAISASIGAGVAAFGGVGLVAGGAMAAIGAATGALGGESLAFLQKKATSSKLEQTVNEANDLIKGIEEKLDHVSDNALRFALIKKKNDIERIRDRSEKINQNWNKRMRVIGSVAGGMGARMGFSDMVNEFINGADVVVPNGVDTEASTVSLEESANDPKLSPNTESTESYVDMGPKDQVLDNSPFLSQDNVEGYGDIVGPKNQSLDNSPFLDRNYVDSQLNTNTESTKSYVDMGPKDQALDNSPFLGQDSVEGYDDMVGPKNQSLDNSPFLGQDNLEKLNFDELENFQDEVELEEIELAEKLNEASKVKSGDGITQIIKRQFDLDPTLADRMGVKNTPDGYFKAAKELGYINDTGEVRLNLEQSQGVSYRLEENSNGDIVMNEYSADGDIRNENLSSNRVDANEKFVNKGNLGAQENAKGSTVATKAPTNAEADLFNDYAGTRISPEESAYLTREKIEAVTEGRSFDVNEALDKFRTEAGSTGKPVTITESSIFENNSTDTGNNAGKLDQSVLDKLNTGTNPDEFARGGVTIDTSSALSAKKELLSDAKRMAAEAADQNLNYEGAAARYGVSPEDAVGFKNGLHAEYRGGTIEYDYSGYENFPRGKQALFEGTRENLTDNIHLDRLKAGKIANFEQGMNYTNDSRLGAMSSMDTYKLPNGQYVMEFEGMSKKGMDSYAIVKQKMAELEKITGMKFAEDVMDSSVDSSKNYYTKVFTALTKEQFMALQKMGAHTREVAVEAVNRYNNVA